MNDFRMYAAAPRKYLLLIATAFIFFLFPFAQSANAATTPFTQGKGYVDKKQQGGAYQKYADQPTSLNWDRQSRFNGSTIPAVDWIFKPKNEKVKPFSSSPVIDRYGNIYIGSEDGNLYAVKSDGTVKWKYPTEEGISSSPVIASDGTIYVTSGMTLYAISSSGKGKWVYTIPVEKYSSLWLNSPPAIGKDGTIYVGVSGFYENGVVVAKGRLLAIDPKGNLKWEYKGTGKKSTSSIDSTPAIAGDGTIYVTDTYYSRYGDFVALSGNIHAVTPSGKQKWMHEIGSYTDASPVIGADGTVYVGSEDENFYAFDPSDGHVNWQTETGGDIVGGAAIDKKGMIYVGSRDGKLYAIEPKKGKVQWTFQTQDGIQSTPLVDASGVVYFGSDDSYFYALDSSKKGALKWKASTGGEIVASPTISQDGDIYISSRDGNLYAFNKKGKPSYSVSGQVLDKKTKKPIYKATVTIAGQKRTTDANGRFTLQGIPASSYVVTIEKEGFYTYTDNSFVVSKEGSKKSFSFYLKPGGKLTVKPSKGVAHTKIAVSGTGFPIDESGNVFLDQNKNGSLDTNEKSIYVKTDMTGSFVPSPYDYIIVPDLAAAQYPILYTSDTIAKDPISVTPAMFTVLPSTAKMQANLKTATPHVKVTISGSGFAAGERGYVYFDKNKNKKFDWDEPSQYISDMPKGSFSDVTLSIPNVKPGTYSIAFESSIGPLKVSALSLTVKATPAKLAVTPASGSAGNSFTVSGTFFPAGESGSVYLDVNKNGKYDYSTDPSTYVYANDKGKFTSSSLTVPDAKTGSYKVLFQASSDSLNAAPAVFRITATAAKMTASPTKGSPFTSIKVTGSLFPPNFSGYAYFDTNKDGTLQYSEEPYASVYTSSSGTFEGTLKAPSAAPGTYQIRFQASSGTLTVPSIPFALQKSSAALSISPSTGAPHSTVTVKGTKLPANDYGQVYVDVNNNGKWDYDGNETYTSVSADGNGTFSGTLGIPDVAPKTYNVRYQSSNYSDLQLPPAILTITSSTARLQSSAAAVDRGKSVEITGTGFPQGESGYVYVDINGDGKLGYYNNTYGYEPYIYGFTGGKSTLSIGADIAPGNYVVRYESSSSYGPLKVPTIPLQIK